jgi:SPP1 family predicted phage head-tail adaptor
MRAGKLRHRVELQKPTESTLGSDGLPVVTWSTQERRWAEIRPLSARELFAAQQVQAQVTHAVKLRWTNPLNAKYRIKWNTRYFGIESVIDPDERNVEHTLLCREVA